MRDPPFCGMLVRRAGDAGAMADTRNLAAAVLAVLCLVAPAHPAGRAGPAECRAGPTRAETLDGIGPRGELRLASGARAVLESLRWPDLEDVAAAARTWLEARRGSTLTLVPRGPPDRWGREHVDAQLDGGDLDLAGGLIGAGLAYADAGEADSLCRAALLTVKAAARERRLGVWAAPLPGAGDGSVLRALAGRFAVIEGRVRHVGERSTRTYLDFAARGEDGLTVTVTKRTWRMMRARGLNADSLTGRRVRVRGILEVRRGPTVDAASAEAIEVLGDTVREDADTASAGDRGLRR